MKTDSIFYRLFQTFPSLIFELIDISLDRSGQYQFKSVELKQTAFRLDGVFSPPENESHLPLFFVEVQFQPESDFYSRFFSEIFLYLRQYRPTNSWRGIIIYPSHRIDTGETTHYGELLNSGRVRCIYLDEIAQNCPQTLGLSLVQLIITPADIAVNAARNLVERTKQEVSSRQQQTQILDLIETIIVYKLPMLGRQEIQQMLGFTEIDLKQTRFYQEVFAEGEQVGAHRGEQVGEQKAKLESIPRMVKLGLSVEIIAEALDLPLEVVRQVAQQD